MTYGAGVTYTELIEALKKERMAINNLPSLPHINVVGSIVTGTHGSGIHNPAMSTFVSQVAFVNPDGQLRRLTR